MNIKCNWCGEQILDEPYGLQLYRGTMLCMDFDMLHWIVYILLCLFSLIIVVKMISSVIYFIRTDEIEHKIKQLKKPE